MNGGCTDQRFLDAEWAAYQELLRAREEAARILEEEITSIEKEYKKMLAKINQDYVANLNRCGNDPACTRAAKEDNDKYVNRVGTYRDEGLYVAQGKELSAKEKAQEEYEKAVKEAREKYCKRGFRATGQTADLRYSGTICDLEKPFTVNGSIYNYKFNFLPTSSTAGAWTTSMSGPSVTGEGGGTYKIEGADTDHPKIAMTGTTTGHTPIGSRSGGGTVYVDLVPLEGNECSGSQ
jgi:hypothetical protein